MPRNYPQRSRKEQQQQDTMQQIQMLQGLKSLMPDQNEGMRTLAMMQGLANAPLEQEMQRAQLADQQQRTQFSADEHPLMQAARQLEMDRQRQQMEQSAALHPYALGEAQVAPDIARERLKGMQLENEYTPQAHELALLSGRQAFDTASQLDPLRIAGAQLDLNHAGVMNPLLEQQGRMGLDQQAWQNSATQDQWQFQREQDLYKQLAGEQVLPSELIQNDLRIQGLQAQNEGQLLENEARRRAAAEYDNVLNPNGVAPSGGPIVSQSDFERSVLPGATPEELKKIQHGVAPSDAGGLRDLFNPDKLLDNPNLAIPREILRVFPNGTWWNPDIENKMYWDDWFQQLMQQLSGAPAQ